MRMLFLHPVAVLLAGTCWAPAYGQAPSFARQIKPFFAKYCLECHAGKEPEAGLDLTTYKGLLAGGDHGSVLTAGQPDASRMVRMVEGKVKPFMPPKKAKQVAPAEIGLLRAWIASGAKEDAAAGSVVLAEIKPRVPSQPPVTALAYQPDGKLLAAGSQGKVLLLDPRTGELRGQLPGQTERVTALSFSPDGRLLAAASGAPGAAGEIRVYRCEAGASPSLPAGPPALTIPAHQDAIYCLAFSPDGKTLASCGYDRVIHLWDTATGGKVRDLKDHSDAVYAVAFSPDGRLLASGSADRAVKVWDVATGRRLFTLAEATDWIYTLAWQPQGGYLAAAGVDKSVRVWQVSAQGGKIVHSVFAHEGPITRLVYATDGKTLYTLGEDRALKAWDTGRMVERFVYPRQPETPLSVAVRPDQQQLAVGRFDGVLALLAEADGKVQVEPLPIKPRPPALNKIIPTAGVRGQTIKLKLEGQSLLDAAVVSATVPGAKLELGPGSTPNALEVLATIPASTPAGAYQVSVKTAGGQTSSLPFLVDLFPQVEAAGKRTSPKTAPKVMLPATVVGNIDRAGAVDFFRFDARAGQQIGVQVLTAAIGSKLDPILQLTDGEGQVLLETSNGLLGYSCSQAGTYALGIRDREYRGDAAMSYRLHVGDVPIVTAVFPLGLQHGTEADVQLQGVHLGTSRGVRIKVPADTAPGTQVPLSVSTPHGIPLGNPTVVVGEFPEVISPEKDRLIPVPATVNGRLTEPGGSDVWRFEARKGQRLLLEVNARRLGSPLDSLIEILDGKGQLVPVATLRCVSQTYITFRDHDSAAPGIRIETWNDLAMNDYLLAGSEVIRIKALPRNPDDDCQFFSDKSQRLGYFGTTPTFHSLGQPMYKVQVHPPGTTFSPNGLPVVTLYMRNDDGGPGFGKDSRLVFDPPADGLYQVRVRDARGQGGSLHAYRLTVRPPRPSYTVQFSPPSPAVSKGSAVPINVTAERLDEYDGPIALQLENLPPGFSAPATSIPAGEKSTSFALYAEPTAQVPAKAAPLKLTARAAIEGKEVVREVSGGMPSLIEAGDIATSTEQAEVTVKPGGEVKVHVKIERRNGFKGRVPLDVRGLPHGVHVLDVGLNGILITESETTRTFVIYAEPWVQPTVHPFVVLARNERKGTEHAARSMLLKVLR